AAAAAALRAAMGLVPAPNGERAAALVLAAENLADHLTHFYLFFMPDFARAAYRGHAWHAAACARFKAVEGSATAEVLPARAAFLELTGTLAGKWPHTLALQPGGSTRAVAMNDKLRLLALLRRFRAFLETRLFADTLEAVAALDSEAALWRWCDARAPHEGDFRHFLAIARALGLASLGRGHDRFLSGGAYRLDDAPLFTAGLWRAGSAAVEAFDPAAIREDG
ncbi:ferredoxin hydrogenase large subunit, partial [Thauera phenylacetica B4P]